MKSKLIVLALTIICLFGVAAWAIQQFIILPSFIQLERHEAQNNMNRAVSALDREVRGLDNLCHDYAAWDDTYSFISDHNKKYLESNIVEETYRDLKLNLILYFNSQGNYVAGDGYDLVRGEFINHDDLIPIRPGHPLLSHKTATDAHAGIIDTHRGPMLVSSQPIITSANHGPVKGTFMVGWLLDNSRITQLKNQLFIDLEVLSITHDSLTHNDQAVLRQLQQDSDNFVATEQQGVTRLQAYKTFAGLNGAPILLLKATLPRDILATGLLTMKHSLLSTMSAGLLVIIGMVISIHYFIANPLMQLVNHLTVLKNTGDLRSISFAKRKDEIGKLYEAFNALTEQLNEKNRSKAIIEHEKEKLIAELQEALSRVQLLSGLLPICSSCKMIQDDQGKWTHIEWYIKQHSNADFSHGICPDCAKKLYPELFTLNS